MAKQVPGCDWDLCQSCWCGPAQSAELDSHRQNCRAFAEAFNEAHERIFVPVVPLFEALLEKPHPASSLPPPPPLSNAPQEEKGAEEERGCRLARLRLRGVGEGSPPLLPLADVNCFLAEQQRSAEEVLDSVVASLPLAAVTAEEEGGELPASVSFVDAEGDHSTLILEASSEAQHSGIRRLSWHAGGQCYLESVGILEWDNGGTISAPEHPQLLARIVDPPVGPARDALLRDIVRMAHAGGGVHLRGFAGGNALVSEAEVRVAVVCQHLKAVLSTWALSVDYIEAMLWQQLVSAIGSAIGPQGEPCIPQAALSSQSALVSA